MKALLPASLLAASLLLAGCASPPGGSGVAGDIGMPGVRFDPVEFHAKVGQRVVWANTGTLAHTVTADDGAFDSGQLLPETDPFAHTFTAPGTYTYHCKPHASRAANGTWEGMVGRIVVTA